MIGTFNFSIALSHVTTKRLLNEARLTYPQEGLLFLVKCLVFVPVGGGEQCDRRQTRLQLPTKCFCYVPLISRL